MVHTHSAYATTFAVLHEPIPADPLRDRPSAHGQRAGRGLRHLRERGAREPRLRRARRRRAGCAAREPRSRSRSARPRRGGRNARDPRDARGDVLARTRHRRAAHPPAEEIGRSSSRYRTYGQPREPADEGRRDRRAAGRRFEQVELRSPCRPRTRSSSRSRPVVSAARTCTSLTAVLPPEPPLCSDTSRSAGSWPRVTAPPLARRASRDHALHGLWRLRALPAGDERLCEDLVSITGVLERHGGFAERLVVEPRRRSRAGGAGARGGCDARRCRRDRRERGPSCPAVPGLRRARRRPRRLPGRELLRAERRECSWSSSPRRRGATLCGARPCRHRRPRRRPAPTS